MDVNEAYTSKTVSWTSEIIPNLGDTKFLKSPSHRRVMSRDINNEWCAEGFSYGLSPTLGQRALVGKPSLRECIS
ncbi:hypothetical protein NWP20_00005, partial [Chrysosporum ovalisporum FSS-44]|nr:hypothetical protein [Umezakia ovalisporum FSS-43]MDH6071296.1 hypothetical protein [Umezakia ovalisporum CobakiLakeA]MDH6079807.1 hypothetical protein [Umezakia ovalisporum FSS-44]MDH6094411.1 hypothetical protein [Umezakia ovalisporum CobakiLakeB]